MPKPGAQRQREYRQRLKEQRLAAVPSLAPVGDGGAPDGGFGPAGQRLWESVVADYELSAHEEAILTQACRAADKLEAIDAALRDAPMVVDTRNGPAAHPLLNEQRQQALLLARMVAALQLPAGEEGPAGVQRGSRRTHRPAGGFRGVYLPRGG
jgi:hypothetical protein